MIDTIIFDWFRVISKRRMFTDISTELSKISEYSQPEIIQRMVDNQGGYILGDENISGFYRALNLDMPFEDFRRIFSNPGELNANIVELVQSLNQNYNLILLSNNYDVIVDNIKKSEVSKLFSRLFFSCDLGMKKPEHSVYMKVISDTGISSECCLFIDDRPKNCEAAREVGWKAIQYTNYKNLIKELSLFGIYVNALSL